MLCIFGGGATPLPVLREGAVTRHLYFLTELSFMRFSLEAAYVGELRHYQEVYDISGALAVHGYETERYELCQRTVWLHGIVFRIGALVLCSALRRSPTS